MKVPQTKASNGVAIKSAPVRQVAPWPHFEEDEITAATHVLRSGRVNYWTGVQCREFETEYANYVGVEHAIAVTNGTAAIELALYALDIGEGDEVITTARTFVASASAIAFRGAIPVIADVDRNSGNITAETIKPLVTDRTKAIVVVHLAGWPCDMDPIMELAELHGIKVIEDCAQAHGATYKDRPIGSMGHIGCFSFCQDKIITTGGEGGLLVTDDTEAYKRAWAFKDHGKDYDLVHHVEHPTGYRWLVKSFGTNLRMTEMQAAIGRIALRKLPSWVKARQRNAAVIRHHLLGLSAVRVPVPSEESVHAYYRIYAYLQPEQLREGWDRERIISEIASRGVPCQSGSCSEIYLEEAFRANGWGPTERLPVAQELGETSIAFLVHPTLDEHTVTWFGQVAREVLLEASVESRVVVAAR